MSLNLSIKNVPETLARKLRARAVRNHRSLQGELMAILEQAVDSPDSLGSDAVLEHIRKMGLKTPATAVKVIRGDRDAR